MEREILDFVQKELERHGIDFEVGDHEITMAKGTRMQSSFYVEGNEKPVLTIGVVFEKKVHYAIVINYDKESGKVTKFRAIVPNISTYEGKTVDSLFIKLLSISTMVVEKVLKSDVNPNIATLEQVFEK
jgi:hypothetical protein